MAYKRISGTVQAVNSRNGKSFQLDDGEWYGAFKATQLKGAEVGDTVSFDMEANEKGGTTFFNIKGDVTVTGKSPPAKEEKSGGSAPTTGGRTVRDRSIERQSILKVTAELLKGRVTPDTDLQSLAEDAIEFSKLLESYVTNGASDEE